jgi:hypothetical protein
MNDIQQNTTPLENEITIFDLLLTAKTFLIYVLKRIYIPILLSGLLGYYMYTSEAKKDRVYTGTLTFTLNQAAINVTENPLTQYFQQSNPSLDRINELLTSDKIIRQALFSDAVIGNQNTWLINHYSKIFDEGMVFNKDSVNPNRLSIKENEKVNQIIVKIRKKILSTFVSEGEIISVFSKSSSEEFSYRLVKSIFASLTDFYVESSTSKYKEGYKQMKRRVDSLESLLSATEVDLATDYDSHLGMVRRKEEVRQEQKLRAVNVNTEKYYEAVKQFETARVLLETQTPLIQLIDDPSLPLPYTQPDQKKALISGLLIGFGLGIVLVVAMKFLIDTWKKEKAKHLLVEAARQKARENKI